MALSAKIVESWYLGGILVGRTWGDTIFELDWGHAPADTGLRRIAFGIATPHGDAAPLDLSIVADTATPFTLTQVGEAAMSFAVDGAGDTTYGTIPDGVVVRTTWAAGSVDIGESWGVPPASLGISWDFSPPMRGDVGLIIGASLPAFVIAAPRGFQIAPNQPGVQWQVGASLPSMTFTATGQSPFVLPQLAADMSFAVGGSGSVRAGRHGDSQAIADAVWAKAIEAGMTAEDLMRVIASFSAASAIGMNGPTVRFRDLGNTKDRIVATLDQNGNRTITAIDPS